MPESQVNQRLAEIIGRIAKLPGANLEPPQFFANYLQLTVAATGSVGGAIWVIQPSEAPQCYCHIEIELAGLDQPGQQRLVTEAIQRCAQDAKPLVMPVGGAETADLDGAGAEAANLCGYPLFFKPLRAANQVAMVVQLIGAADAPTQQLRAVVGLLDQIGEYGEMYLAHRRATVLDDDRKALARLLQYAESVHGSLDPETVIYQLANMGRDVLGCERTVVWVDPAVKRGLRAVSGVDKPDRRAVLLQAVEKLSRHCLKIKKPIVAGRDQLAALPDEDELTGLLKHYFNVSKLDQVLLQPLETEQGLVGVFVAEGFDEQNASNAAGLAASVGKHGGLALGNALQMASTPLMRPLARLKKAGADPKRRRKWVGMLAVVLIILIVAALTPWTVRIECGCELAPKERLIIDAPLDGVQVSRVVKSKGQVEKGEVVVELDDLELKAGLAVLDAELQGVEVRRNSAKRSNPTEAAYLEHEVDRINNRMALLQKQIAKCQLKAPIAGTILTAQRDMEELVGRTLAKGDPICEIADLANWQLLLRVPQEEIAWVQRGLAEGDGARVKFFLAAYPEERLEAEIADAGEISQTPRIDQEGNTYEVRVAVSGEELAELMAGLRDGSIGRAKIDTVKRPLGYVLLRKVIRFFRVTFF